MDSPDAAAVSSEEQRQTTPFLVLQFFIFPMAIVAACVAVFMLFGFIASESATPRDYLAEVRRGGGVLDVKRWQAAFALAGAIESRKEEVRADPDFGRELVELYRESGGWPDPRIRRYLTVALGRLEDPRAVLVLRAVLQEGDQADAQTRIYALLALGTLRAAEALPEVEKAASADDAGLRKAAVHTLGSLPAAARINELLAQALNDATEDVRWNAALALARHGDMAALPMLEQMLDRSHVEGVPGVTAEQADAVLEHALAAAAALRAEPLRPALEHLRDHDTNLRLRGAARAALDRLGQGSPDLTPTDRRVE